MLTNRRPDRLRRLLAATRTLIALIALAFLLASPVSAEDILKLTGPVTDTTGVLADGHDDIVKQIDTTRDTQGVQVFVLFVKNTGDLTATDFADQTATGTRSAATTPWSSSRSTTGPTRSGSPTASLDHQ